MLTMPGAASRDRLKLINTLEVTIVRGCFISELECFDRLPARDIGWYGKMQVGSLATKTAIIETETNSKKGTFICLVPIEFHP